MGFVTKIEEPDVLVSPNPKRKGSFFQHSFFPRVLAVSFGKGIFVSIREFESSKMVEYYFSSFIC